MVGVHQNNRELTNVFNGQVATPEQAADMMRFRDIGLEANKHYINTRLIHSNMMNVPLRRQRLLTMSSMKTRKKRMTPKELEAKQVIKCLR